MKNVAGFDLTRLCIGSWGTLGVVTSVTVRLSPLPEKDVTLVVGASCAEDLLEAARRLATSSLPLGGLELTEGSGLSEEGASQEARLAVRVLGSPEEVGELERRIRGLDGSLSFRRMEDGTSRELHAAMERWEEGAGLVLRLSLLPSRLGELLEGARAFLVSLGEMGKEGVRLAAHVGAGVLRIRFEALQERRGEEGVAQWADGLRWLRDAMEGAGGSLTVSYGPPALVRAVGAWGKVGDVGSLVSGLKREFDPVGILAPGRFVA